MSCKWLSWGFWQSCAVVGLVSRRIRHGRRPWLTAGHGLRQRHCGLTFLFELGNVLVFGLGLGVSGWVAPLVTPALEQSVLALLIAIRQLSLCGASADVNRHARSLLLVSSVVRLALNVAEPLVAGEWGTCRCGRPTAADRMGRPRSESSEIDRSEGSSRRPSRRGGSPPARIQPLVSAAPQYTPGPRSGQGLFIPWNNKMRTAG